MPKLPVISGKQAIKAFKKSGYQVIHQRSSHVRLHHSTNPAIKPLTIPLHNELGKGLLRKLLRDAEITVEDFKQLLK